MRFAIVTPVKNCVATIDETVLSVVTQIGQFAVDYHVQDGGSEDGTVEKVCAWARRMESGAFPIGCEEVRFSYASAPDGGMYAALNHGFVRVAGDFMGWINGDDRLEPGALSTACTLFTQYPGVEWLGGRRAYINEEGSLVALLDVLPYARPLLETGLYEGRRIGFLQQEGVFWRRELWRRCGGRVDEALRYAGDFELWCRFAEKAEYVSVDSPLGVFRVRTGQATNELSRYYGEIDGLFVGERRERREELWRLFLEARRSGRASHSVDLSGSIIEYDTLIQRWAFSRRSCLAVHYRRPDAISKAGRMLMRWWFSRQKVRQTE